jgi:hypothetical protein
MQHVVCLNVGRVSFGYIPQNFKEIAILGTVLGVYSCINYIGNNYIFVY